MHGLVARGLPVRHGRARDLQPLPVFRRAACQSGASLFRLGLPHALLPALRGPLRCAGAARHGGQSGSASAHGAESQRTALHGTPAIAVPDPPSQVGTGPEHWNTLERVSYVRLKGRWVAYPFQNNISALELDDQVTCLKGLVDAKVLHATSNAPPKDFDEWILRTQARISPPPFFYLLSQLSPPGHGYRQPVHAPLQLQGVGGAHHDDAVRLAGRAGGGAGCGPGNHQRAAQPRGCGLGAQRRVPLPHTVRLPAAARRESPVC